MYRREVKYDSFDKAEDIQYQYIWYNKAIKINDKSVYNHSLLRCGLWLIKDLYDGPNIISFNTWLSRCASPKDYILWRGIINLSKQWKHNLLMELTDEINTMQPRVKVKNNYIYLSKTTLKDIRQHLIEERFTHIAESDFQAKQKHNMIFSNLNQDM